MTVTMPAVGQLAGATPIIPAQGQGPTEGQVQAPVDATTDGPPIQGSPTQGPPAQYPPYPYQYFEPQPDRFGRFLTRMVERTPRWAGPLAAAGGIAMALGYTVLVRPTSVTAGTNPACIFRMLTGFDCPGCGGTRAAWYLMHGDIMAAAWHHAPLVFAAPFLVYLYLVWALNASFGLRLPQLQVSTRSLMFFMAGWSIFSVLRNLPWAPFAMFYV